jgi:hypothetical protein
MTFAFEIDSQQRLRTADIVSWNMSMSLFREDEGCEALDFEHRYVTSFWAAP